MGSRNGRKWHARRTTRPRVRTDEAKRAAQFERDYWRAVHALLSPPRGTIALPE